jgi:hypothetical protein
MGVRPTKSIRTSCKRSTGRLAPFRVYFADSARTDGAVLDNDLPIGVFAGGRT